MEKNEIIEDIISLLVSQLMKNNIKKINANISSIAFFDKKLYIFGMNNTFIYDIQRYINIQYNLPIFGGNIFNTNPR